MRRGRLLKDLHDKLERKQTLHPNIRYQNTLHAKLNKSKHNCSLLCPAFPPTRHISNPSCGCHTPTACLHGSHCYWLLKCRQPDRLGEGELLGCHARLPHLKWLFLCFLFAPGRGGGGTVQAPNQAIHFSSVAARSNTVSCYLRVDSIAGWSAIAATATVDLVSNQIQSNPTAILG
jgi:hypothetical protein